MDNAATSLQKPLQVDQAVLEALRTAGNPGRGAHEATLHASRLVYGARAAAAEMFDAEDASRIAFTANATEALNIAISGLIRPGDHVITTVCEHNSVLRPLYRLRDQGATLSFVGVDARGNLKYEELEAFLAQVDWEKAGIDFKREQLEFHGERVYYMPENLPELKGARFLRSGLLLGELKNTRFEPSQALAMNLKMEEYAHTLNLSSDDDRLMRYLKGETIDVEDLIPAKAKGWHLICTDGFPLGWGKVTNGTLKNKYLPGWRNQSA